MPQEKDRTRKYRKRFRRKIKVSKEISSKNQNIESDKVEKSKHRKIEISTNKTISKDVTYRHDRVIRRSSLLDHFHYPPSSFQSTVFFFLLLLMHSFVVITRRRRAAHFRSSLFSRTQASSLVLQTLNWRLWVDH